MTLIKLRKSVRLPYDTLVGGQCYFNGQTVKTIKRVCYFTLKVALSFPNNKFHEQIPQELAYIYHDTFF